MPIGLGIDQLSTDADLIAHPPYASFEHVAHAQLAANLLGVDSPVSIRERRFREMTNMPPIRDRSVVTSSVIASAKYCWSESLLRLVKGSTTIDRRRGRRSSLLETAALRSPSASR